MLDKYRVLLPDKLEDYLKIGYFNLTAIILGE